MPIFAVAIFLSAFLLFQVQPVIARYILPWYGGSPAVWTTCLLFFQCGLLGGYAYAHALVSFLRERRKLQVGIHLGLLAISLIVLPITPEESLQPEGASAQPIIGIIRLLSLTVGFPYLLLSASGPLLQHWFGEAFPGRSPYRLYAVSNIGSILGLLTYPFLFEPLLAVSKQTLTWSIAYGAYALTAAVCALAYLKRVKSHPPIGESTTEAATRTPLFDKILWVAFAACGSMLLLSLTNQMCQDVAVVPFLWVLPLALYLLTFVITFDHSRWYRRRAAIPLAILSVAAVAYLINQQFAATEMHLGWQVTIYVGAIFFGCLICHGEVVRLKPPSSRLTAFYLAISLGGALGGLFVSAAAPLIFDGYWELHWSLLFLVVLVSIQLFRRFRNQLKTRFVRAGIVGWVGLIATLCYSLNTQVKFTREDALDTMRGFYGVLRVYDLNLYTSDHFLALYHGRISHGRQYTHEDFRNVAPTYYSEDSGIGAIFKCHKSRVIPEPMHVAVVGLGIGTVSAYMRPEDRIRFYEINPQVETLARKHFTYLEDCLGEESVVLGDARISMEEEWKESGSQQFDVIVVDAFSGDSIPIHLITVEAMKLYTRHLKPDGVIAIHVSNLHLNLSDLVHNLAENAGYGAIRVEYDPLYEETMYYYSDWILLSKHDKFLSLVEKKGYSSEWRNDSDPDLLWTDDYSNLLQVIDW